MEECSISRFLGVWELGGGTGHLHKLGALAKALGRRGHEVRLAVREVGTAARVLGQHAPPVLAAPFFTGRVTGLPPSANYAEVLLRCGYLDSSGLTALIKAWIALFDLARPDVVVADHAPTAILAARVAGIPTAVIGSGFLLPPLAHPMPDLQPWQPMSRERLISAELRVLEPINRSLASRCGASGDLGDVPRHPRGHRQPGPTGADRWRRRSDPARAGGARRGAGRRTGSVCAGRPEHRRRRSDRPHRNLRAHWQQRYRHR